MRDEPGDDAARPFTGWHMLVLVCSFFAVVIAANATLAVYATGSWSGLVVENSYVASQNFNSDLDKARAQRALGWTSRLEPGSGELVFSLSDATGQPIAGAAVEAELERPANTDEDRTLAFVERGGGDYVYRGQLRAGLWNASVTVADSAGRRYRQDFRLYVRPEK
ncbi:MAG: FixH family protein [Hyphomicrobiales bacterium]